MVIFSLSKKTVFILGEALIITGGKVSFGPPVGADFLAHWVRETTIKKNKKVLPGFNHTHLLWRQNNAIFSRQPTGKRYNTEATSTILQNGFTTAYNRCPSGDHIVH